MQRRPGRRVAVIGRGDRGGGTRRKGGGGRGSGGDGAARGPFRSWCWRRRQRKSHAGAWENDSGGPATRTVAVAAVAGHRLRSGGRAAAPPVSIATAALSRSRRYRHRCAPALAADAAAAADAPLSALQQPSRPSATPTANRAARAYGRPQEGEWE